MKKCLENTKIAKLKYNIIYVYHKIEFYVVY
jgi:hypothetical protein